MKVVDTGGFISRLILTLLTQKYLARTLAPLTTLAYSDLQLART